MHCTVYSILCVLYILPKQYCTMYSVYSIIEAEWQLMKGSADKFGLYLASDILVTQLL